MEKRTAFTNVYWSNLKKTALPLNRNLHIPSGRFKLPTGVGRATAVLKSAADPSRFMAEQGGGKSGLHRAGCQITSGRREPTESATENIPPRICLKTVRGKGEKVR